MEALNEKAHAAAAALAALVDNVDAGRVALTWTEDSENAPGAVANMDTARAAVAAWRFTLAALAVEASEGAHVLAAALKREAQPEEAARLAAAGEDLRRRAQDWRDNGGRHAADLAAKAALVAVLAMNYHGTTRKGRTVDAARIVQKAAHVVAFGSLDARPAVDLQGLGAALALGPGAMADNIRRHDVADPATLAGLLPGLCSHCQARPARLDSMTEDEGGHLCGRCETALYNPDPDA